MHFILIHYFLILFVHVLSELNVTISLNIITAHIMNHCFLDNKILQRKKITLLSKQKKKEKLSYRIL